MLTHIWWSLPLTIVVFYLARKLSVKFKLPILNPLLITIAVLIAILVITNTSYEHYFAGSKILNDLLQPAVVALAFPCMSKCTKFVPNGNLCLVSALRVASSRCSVAQQLHFGSGQRRISPPQYYRNLLRRQLRWRLPIQLVGSLQLVPLVCCLWGF